MHNVLTESVGKWLLLAFLSTFEIFLSENHFPHEYKFRLRNLKTFFLSLMSVDIKHLPSSHFIASGLVNCLIHI